ncbi:uroporphyrinogen decarboxylase family protein [Thermincola potens]|nr:uroporphyrinogen decarboxylase family protein [Thermincola potens]
MTSKQRVLGLLKGETVDRPACYSGTGTVWGAALKHYGYNFADAHHDPEKMARLATFPFEAAGFECALMPFDICVEAELLGCDINYFSNSDESIYPNIKKRLIMKPNEIEGVEVPDHVMGGRVPVVCNAIRQAKAEFGQHIPIGAHILGPFTLATHLMDFNELLMTVFRKPDLVSGLLEKLAGVLMNVARAYEEAGADYICLREMSGTTDIVSPKQFNELLRPELVKIIQNCRVPVVLHICGNTNKIVQYMVECNAHAISVETRNDLVRTRQDIGNGPLVFGNIDGFGVLVKGTPEEVEQEVIKCLRNGVDALWPGCEISLKAPLENLRAMVRAVEKHGHSEWHRKS